MKFILSLIVAVLLTASPALSQTRPTPKGKAKKSTAAKYEKRIETAAPAAPTDAPEPPPPPPAPAPVREKPSSDVFKTVTIEKWGVAKLGVPANLKAEPEREETQNNGDVSWITYSRAWKLPSASVYGLAPLEVDLTVRTWNRDFTFVKELRKDLATPENMLLMDLMAGERDKNTPGTFLREADALDVNGARGAFFRAEMGTGGKRFLAGWQTYRYYEGKAQLVSLSFSGNASELPQILKILHTLELR